MRIGERGIALIQDFEGLRLCGYLCPAGVPTVGYGHTKGVEVGQCYTLAQIDQWLLEDVKDAEDAVNEFGSDFPLTQNQFDALVAFTFNIGVLAFRNSTLCRMLSAGNFDGAKDQFRRWNKVKREPVAGLTRRREAERALFVS